MLQSGMPIQDKKETFFSQFVKRGHTKELYSLILEGHNQLHMRYVAVPGTPMTVRVQVIAL